MKAALPVRPPAPAARPDARALWRRFRDDDRLIRAKVLLIGLLVVAGAVLEQVIR